MRINLYIKEEDQPIIDKAKEMLEDQNSSLSRFLVQSCAIYTKMPVRDIWAAIDKLEGRVYDLERNPRIKK